MKYRFLPGPGYADAPGTLSKAVSDGRNGDGDERAEFLKDYLEALYLSIRCGHTPCSLPAR
jgi:hypothetical protein